MSRAASDLSALADFAVRMTREAGAVALRRFRLPATDGGDEVDGMGGVGVENKEDNTVVTRADRECELRMRDMIARAFPAHGVVGEEFGADARDETWVLDPIDGTLSFITGSPLFCVLAAFLRDGRPVLGVIHLPATGDTWTGVCAPGNPSATFNGAPCRVNGAKALDRAVGAVTTLGWRDDDDDRRLRRLLAAAQRCRLGGDGFNYGCVAAGFADFAADYDMAPYDYLAPAAALAAAGGVMTDWRGAPLTLASGRTAVVAAASAPLHRAALAALAA